MKQLIQLITNAIAFISGLKSTNTKLAEENKTLRDQLGTAPAEIQTLKDKLAADELDDAALEEAAKSAQARADEANNRATALQAEIDAANVEGEKLAAALTDNPDAPSVNSDFTPVG